MSKIEIQFFIPQACNVPILLFIKNLPPCWFGLMLIYACDIMFNSQNLQLYIRYPVGNELPHTPPPR